MNNEQLRNPAGRAYYLLGLIALCGVAFIALLTPHGPGLWADSFNYLEGASSIAAGKGYTYPSWDGPSPITAWPPFFSLLVALVSVVVGDVPTSAKWINACLMGINVWLTGYLTLKYTKASKTAALLTALFFCWSWLVLNIHAVAMSEPLFTCLSLAGFICFLRFSETGRVIVLIGSAVLFSLALLTRFFALPFIVAGGVWLMFGVGRTWRTRIFHCAVFCGIAAASGAAFSVRNHFVMHAAIPVSFQFRVFPSSYVTNLLAAAPFWATPIWLHFRSAIYIIIYLGAVGLLALGVSRAFMHPGEAVFKTGSKGFLFCSFIASYALFDVVMVGWAHQDIGFIWHMQRDWIPVLPIVLALLAGGVCEAYRQSTRPRLWATISLLLAMLLLGGTLRVSFVWLRMERIDGGILYSRSDWRDSESLSFIRTLPDGKKIITNEFLAVHFYTGRSALEVPAVHDFEFRPESISQAQSRYSQQLRLCRSALEKRGGVRIYFKMSIWRHLAEEGTLVRDLRLKMVKTLKDGTVYELAE